MKSVEFVENFINSVGLNFGVARKLSNLLLDSEEKCNDFFVGFLGKNNDIIDDLLDYRESILSTYNVTFDEFTEACNNDLKSAFEKTFLQPLSFSDARLIESAISTGKTSLKSIYDSFKRNVNENVLKNAL